MKIIIAGDYSPRYELNEVISNERYSKLFNEVKPIISSSDFAIVNFETVIPTTDCKKIAKAGPNLKTVPKAIEALKYTGFNIVTLANNHTLDFGYKGLKETILLLNKNNIFHVGAGDNIYDAEKPLLLYKDGQKTAIINCCEHEFSIATKNHGGCAPLNPIRQYQLIKKTKIDNDYVVVIVHGGHEYFPLPSERMQETYRFFIDAGADVVINHHQHCYSGMEEYHGKYIFYGLGNFLFDRVKNIPEDGWNNGILVELALNENIDYKVIPYIQCLDKLGVYPLKNEFSIKEFEKEFNKLNNIISNEDQLTTKIGEFYNNVLSKDILVSFEPYNHRLLNAAYNRKLLPSFFHGEKLARLLNVVECEAHNDVAKFLLRNKIKSL